MASFAFFFMRDLMIPFVRVRDGKAKQDDAAWLDFFETCRFLMDGWYSDFSCIVTF